MIFEWRRRRRNSALWDIATVVLLLLLAPVTLARELLTFDGQAEPVSLTPLAKTKLEFWRPESAIRDRDPTPQERALRISGEAGSGFVTKIESAKTLDWQKTESIAFWVHRSAEELKEHPTVSLDVRLIEEDNNAHFWRKVDLPHRGWQKIVLPLDWFRWSDGRIPRWKKVRSIAFLLRDPAELTIDTVWTIPTERARDEFQSAEVIAAVAFPKDAAGREPPNVRTLETRDAQLLTNALSLDLEQLAGHLALVTKEVRREMPFLAEPDRGPLLVVFQTRDEYRQFVPRYARLLNGQASPPGSAGFTVQSVSVSSWNVQLGSLRPVYTHEFLHGYFCRAARLPCNGDWLHEGLASYFQLKLHPQANLNAIISEGLKSDKHHEPLKELCNGQQIANSRYWQATTLCQMLLTEQRFRAGLPLLFDRLRDSKTTDLGPHLDPVWQTDWEQFSADWRAFCEKQFPKK